MYIYPSASFTLLFGFSMCCIIACVGRENSFDFDIDFSPLCTKDALKDFLELQSFYSSVLLFGSQMFH